MPRPMLLDVDTGVDDAVAIALATLLSEHELVAVTTVAGNVPVELATENTLRVLAWLGADVPVYRGMSAPLVRPLHDARSHHGQTGLGSWNPPAAGRSIEDETAPQAIVRLARKHRGAMTFVFVGPLTNLAVALSLEPRIVEWGPRLVIMGGAFFRPGNTTPHAEFNVYADPEAAGAVAHAWPNATWVGLDATTQALLLSDEWASLATDTSRPARLVYEVGRRAIEELGRPGVTLHDPLAVAVAEDSAVCEYVTGTPRVEVGENRRGETRLSSGSKDDLVVSVATNVNHDRFRALLGRVSARLG